MAGRPKKYAPMSDRERRLLANLMITKARLIVAENPGIGQIPIVPERITRAVSERSES